MFLVNPYNFKLVHRITDLNNRQRTLEVGRSPTGPAPVVTNVLDKSGATPTTVEGENLVGNPISDNELVFSHTSGTLVTLTRDQILAAGGIFQDGVAVVPESLLPDVDMDNVTVVANEQEILFTII